MWCFLYLVTTTNALFYIVIPNYGVTKQDPKRFANLSKTKKKCEAMETPCETIICLGDSDHSCFDAPLNQLVPLKGSRVYIVSTEAAGDASGKADDRFEQEYQKEFGGARELQDSEIILKPNLLDKALLNMGREVDHIIKTFYSTCEKHQLDSTEILVHVVLIVMLTIMIIFHCAAPASKNDRRNRPRPPPKLVPMLPPIIKSQDFAIKVFGALLCVVISGLVKAMQDGYLDIFMKIAISLLPNNSNLDTCRYAIVTALSIIAFIVLILILRTNPECFGGHPLDKNPAANNYFFMFSVSLEKKESASWGIGIEAKDVFKGGFVVTQSAPDSVVARFNESKIKTSQAQYAIGRGDVIVTANGKKLKDLDMEQVKTLFKEAKNKITLTVARISDDLIIPNKLLQSSNAPFEFDFPIAKKKGSSIGLRLNTGSPSANTGLEIQGIMGGTLVDEVLKSGANNIEIGDRIMKINAIEGNNSMLWDELIKGGDEARHIELRIKAKRPEGKRAAVKASSEKWCDWSLRCDSLTGRLEFYSADDTNKFLPGDMLLNVNGEKSTYRAAFEFASATEKTFVYVSRKEIVGPQATTSQPESSGANVTIQIQEKLQPWCTNMGQLQNHNNMIIGDWVRVLDGMANRIQVAQQNPKSGSMIQEKLKRLTQALREAKSNPTMMQRVQSRGPVIAGIGAGIRSATPVRSGSLPLGKGGRKGGKKGGKRFVSGSGTGGASSDTEGPVSSGKGGKKGKKGSKVRSTSLTPSDQIGMGGKGGSQLPSGIGVQPMFQGVSPVGVRPPGGVIPPGVVSPVGVRPPGGVVPPGGPVRPPGGVVPPGGVMPPGGPVRPPGGVVSSMEKAPSDTKSIGAGTLDGGDNRSVDQKTVPTDPSVHSQVELSKSADGSVARNNSLAEDRSIRSVEPPPMNNVKTEDRSIRSVEPPPMDGTTPKSIKSFGAPPLDNVIAEDRSIRSVDPPPMDGTTPKSIKSFGARPLDNMIAENRSIRSVEPPPMDGTTPKSIKSFGAPPMDNVIAEDRSIRSVDPPPMDGTTPKSIKSFGARPMDCTTPKSIKSFGAPPMDNMIAEDRSIRSVDPPPMDGTTPKSIKSFGAPPMDGTTPKSIKSFGAPPMDNMIAEDRSIRSVDLPPMDGTTPKSIKSFGAPPLDNMTAENRSIRSVEPPPMDVTTPKSIKSFGAPPMDNVIAEDRSIRSVDLPPIDAPPSAPPSPSGKAPEDDFIICDDTVEGRAFGETTPDDVVPPSEENGAAPEGEVDGGESDWGSKHNSMPEDDPLTASVNASMAGALLTFCVNSVGASSAASSAFPPQIQENPYPPSISVDDNCMSPLTKDTSPKIDVSGQMAAVSEASEEEIEQKHINSPTSGRQNDGPPVNASVDKSPSKKSSAESNASWGSWN